MAKARLVQRENERHKQAFEIYHTLGPKRSHKVLANKLGVSVSAVKNWSRSFHWRERITERDAYMTRQVIDQSFRQGTEENERNLKIVRAALMRSAKDIAEGKVTVRMRDLAWLIPLEQRLLGIWDSASDRSGQPSPGGVVIYIPDNGRDERPQSTGQDDSGASNPNEAGDSRSGELESRND